MPTPTTQHIPSQSQQISEVNRLHFLHKITEGERLRRVFEIRERYATRVGEQLELFPTVQDTILPPQNNSQEWFGGT